MTTTADDFDELLRDCHIQATYQDVSGQVQRPPVDALLALVQALGVGIQRPDEAGEVLRARRDARRSRGVEPIHLAWDGTAAPLQILLPKRAGHGFVAYELDADAERIERQFTVDELPEAEWGERTDGLIMKLVPLPSPLPWGHHSLKIDVTGTKELRCTVISTPRTAFTHDPARREWGCLLPLYALRTAGDWGTGDYTSLAKLADWVGRQGGSDLGTLPLLAAWLDVPMEISPYRPASRLFWNEFYVDVRAIPELNSSPECQRLVESRDFQQRINGQNSSDLVNYAEVMQLKREALERLAAQFMSEKPPRYAQFQKYVHDRPAVLDYARFRAAVERRRASWPDWPQRLRNGHVEYGDYHQASADYHAYAQWIADEQLTEVQQRAEAAGCGLYLDLPVGVDPGGYDTWRHQDEFLTGARVGAPPDVMFTQGQDWGLPPLDPERIRENGYDLLRRTLATNMRFAGRLRIDHVLGFHRLFCIPPGFSAAEGTYVRYRAEELHAVAVLESHLHRCALVGENLGTVPPEVDEQMAEHAIAGMWVAPYELEPGRREGLKSPKSHQVAMLNTHDMPPVAAWWPGEDIQDRLELGLIEADSVKDERAERQQARAKLITWLRSVGAVDDDEGIAPADVPLRPLLRGLASSPAQMMLINLEDLWLERRPQNIPGNFENRPNWRRKAKYRFEEFSNLPEVLAALADVDRFRKMRKQAK